MLEVNKFRYLFLLPASNNQNTQKSTAAKCSTKR